MLSSPALGYGTSFPPERAPHAPPLRPLFHLLPSHCRLPPPRPALLFRSSPAPMTIAQHAGTCCSFHGLDIEGVPFAPAVVPPGSSKTLVLGGAGARGLEINGNFVKFTAIGIYVEEEVIPHLSPKLKGKTTEQLCEDELLFEELLRAPQDKFVRVVFLVPLTGVQYSEKVLERIGVQGLYTSVPDKYKQQFLEIFKAESFPPRSTVLLSFTQEGLKVAFSKDDAIPEQPVDVVEDATFGEAVLATIIWKEGVSPEAKVSLAERLSKCF